jgi:hypothetical protein
MIAGAGGPEGGSDGLADSGSESCRDSRPIMMMTGASHLLAVTTRALTDRRPRLALSVDSLGGGAEPRRAAAPRAWPRRGHAGWAASGQQ